MPGNDDGRRGGVFLKGAGREAAVREGEALLECLARMNLENEASRDDIRITSGGASIILDARSPAWTPDADTTALCARMGLDPEHSDEDLDRLILLALLRSPVVLEFAGCDGLVSAIRVRRNIVKAARVTALAFDTSDAAERPADCWLYHEDTGFVVRPGHALIDALRKATQPDVSGQMYAFSCYRATEYVILLGLAEELQACNPALLARLQKQWETRAIQSGRFHDIFLHEYGSMEAPLPPRFYVPGDRVWFRNPDRASSDVLGYEGSWVISLGGGLFSNFWQRERPYTLSGKCLELYHWRDGVCSDNGADLWMDEERVAACVRATQANPAQTRAILERMMRLRDPKGVYAKGGCIDTTRESPRGVCPGGVPLELPDA
ncbi:MAG: hypothetical protein KGZ43_02800 [Sulfuritalea sp.]|nr:hypothetical protein [Sulfuritalea sp.]